MSVHGVVVAVLLGLAVGLVLICAVGVMVMRDPLQRLHYVSPPATLCAVLITVAVVLDQPQKQAWLKTLLVTGVLCLMNAVVTHATARAVRVREQGRWQASADERIPIVGQRRYVGQDDEEPSGGRE
ncbi:monovalent cation/H(+) antiporter subunit G [Cystobacter fuscus]